MLHFERKVKHRVTMFYSQHALPCGASAGVKARHPSYLITPPQTTTPCQSRAIHEVQKPQAARRRSTGKGMVLALAGGALRGTD